MGELSFVQIAIVLVIALLVFGPSRLPELGRQIGKGMREVRKHATSFGHEFSNMDADDGRSRPSSVDQPAPPPDTSLDDADLLDGVVVSHAAADVSSPVSEPDGDLLDGVVVSGASPPVSRQE